MTGLLITLVVLQSLSLLMQCAYNGHAAIISKAFQAWASQPKPQPIKLTSVN